MLKKNSMYNSIACAIMAGHSLPLAIKYKICEHSDKEVSLRVSKKHKRLYNDVSTKLSTNWNVFNS